MRFPRCFSQNFSRDPSATQNNKRKKPLSEDAAAGFLQKTEITVDRRAAERYNGLAESFSLSGGISQNPNNQRGPIMKKTRIISLLLALALLLPCAVSGAEGGMPFKDVKEGKWYCKSVKYVYERDLMQGVAKDRFDPNGSLTRAMFVTILCRIHGEEKKNRKSRRLVLP